MNVRAAEQRPELLAAVIDGLPFPVAVVEAAPSPMLAVANSAFEQVAAIARAAGIDLVAEIAERVAAVTSGAAPADRVMPAEGPRGARYAMAIPTPQGALDLECRLTHGAAHEAWIWWATDVTDQRRVQATTDAAAADARRREAELTRSNEDLERFASIASHDLSEPLRMVSSFADLMSRRYRGRLDDQADVYLGYIVDGAARMRALIDALLQFSEVRASEYRREPVDLGQVVQEVCANLHTAIQESGARLEIGPLPAVVADPEAMRQVFQNLIANALKFRAVEPPLVTVSAERIPGEWLLTVADNGIGIPEADRERIFEMFGRLHTRSVYPGSGLGLAMSRRAIEIHGGRIWVDSAPSGGTAFRFTLPTESSLA